MSTASAEEIGRQDQTYPYCTGTKTQSKYSLTVCIKILFYPQADLMKCENCVYTVFGGALETVF
jgi:hypothetical protein